jgi:outer membrane receptor for ferrienterochelin and colicins
MAGMEWKPYLGTGQGLVEVNVFRTDLSDLFNVQEDDDPSTPELELLKVNFGQALVHGVEVNLGWGIGDRIVMQGGFVVQQARFAEAEPDFGSREFFRTPRVYGNFTVTWKPEGIADFFLGMRHTGSMKAPHYAGYIEEPRLETTARFVTADVGVSRPVRLGGGQGLVLSLGVKNVTNAYQKDFDAGPLRDAGYVYGPRFPRAVTFSTRVEF